MARYPGATWKRLPGQEPLIRPRVVVVHTMVGTLPSTDAYFRSGSSGGIEAHFGVGGPWEGAQYDGVVWQWRDTAEQADANYHANGFAVSIETSDGGQPDRTWTPKQVDALVDLSRWLADTHGIPRRICPAWDASGFGWHVMFGAPGPWTPAAKTCPGATRIRQLKEVVLPAIFSGNPPQEDDMNQAEHDALMWLRNNAALLRDQGVRMTDHGDPDEPGRANNLAVVRADLTAFKAQFLAELAELRQAVDRITFGGVVGELDVVGKVNVRQSEGG